MNFLAYLAPSGSRGWLLGTGNRATGVTCNGDLVLSIRDMSRVEELVDDGLLERWADEWQFSLKGIDQDVALYLLLFDYAVPTCLALEENRTITSELQAASVAADPDTIPDLAVRLSGAAVAAAIIRAFDDQGDADHAFQQSVSRRIAFIQAVRVPLGRHGLV